MKTPNVVYVVLSLSLILISTLQYANANNSIERTEEMKLKWESYWEKAIYSTTSEERIVSPGRNSIITRRIMNFPSLVIETDDYNFNKNRIQGFNNKYHFTLSKAMGSSEWKIENIEILNDNHSYSQDWLANSKPVSDRFIHSIRNIILPFIVCGSVPIQELVRLPYCDGTFQEKMINDKLWPIFTYELHKKEGDDNVRYGFMSGTIEFDPVSSLIVRSETILAQNPETKLVIENEYSDIHNSTPGLVKSTESIFVNGKNRTNVDIRKMKTEFETKYEPQRFTLSHYGLPEPDFLIRQSRFQAFRYLLMAVGCLLVLFAVYKMYRKKGINAVESI